MKMNDFINEYKIMFNCYDGKGDQVYSITTNPIKAVEDKAFLYMNLIQEKGTAWIEHRQVSEWKKAVLK